MNYLTLKIATLIYDNSNKEVSKEVLIYSLGIVINFISIIVISLFSATLLGTIYEVIIVMIGFFVLRQYSGGYHIKSSNMCVFVSAIMIVGIGYLSSIVNFEDVWVINFIAMIICLIYSPTKIENQSKFTKKHYPLLKAVSVMIVSVNFAFNSLPLALSFLAQSLTLIERR